MARQRLLWLTNLIAELKRRKVYSVCAAYAVTAWVILQIGEVTLEPMGFSESAMTILIIVVIVGFAVTSVLAWLFDLSAYGVSFDRGKLAATPSNPGAKRSIAVLPFADMSAEKDQAYFCEGVAEEIIGALNRIPNLDVVGRASSFQYRNSAGDIRRIGEELGVTAILEGSVRKSADHLRVSVELVKVADGYRLWARTFDETPGDVFAIQTEIATSVADALLERLTPHERSMLEMNAGVDVTAYDFYLRGRSYFKRFSRAGFESALKMFARAIDIDPSFAAAWAGYSACFSFLVMYSARRVEYREKAEATSRRALELAPELAEAHSARGMALLVSGRFAEADSEFEAAIERDPGLFDAYYFYGRSCFHQGKLDKAADYFRKAADIDPTDFRSRILRIQILRGRGLLEQAREEAREAMGAVEKHLDWYPDDTGALHMGAAALVVLGETDRARRWLERAVEFDPNDSVLRYNVACNLITLGDLEAALDHLEAAAASGTISASWIRNDTDIDAVRSHPRYVRLLERLEQTERAAPESQAKTDAA